MKNTSALTLNAQVLVGRREPHEDRFKDDKHNLLHVKGREVKERQLRRETKIYVFNGWFCVRHNFKSAFNWSSLLWRLRLWQDFEFKASLTFKSKDIFQSHTNLLEFVPILQGHHTNVAALEEQIDIKDRGTLIWEKLLIKDTN